MAPTYRGNKCSLKEEEFVDDDVRKQFSLKEEELVDVYDAPRRNNFPINRHDSRLLVASSCLFSINGIFAFFASLYLYSVVSIITTFVSINYWRYAIEGTRRTADLITSKVSFGIYFISGCIFVRDWNLLAIGIPVCIGIIVFYNLSCRY
jgi:hypothetical protein